MANGLKKTKISHRKIRPLLMALLVIVVVAAGLRYYLLNHRAAPAQSLAGAARGTNSINYGPSTSQDNAANNQRKSSTPSAANQTLTSHAGSTTGSPPSVTVTYARVSNDTLQVGTQINGVTGGTCTLTVSQSGQQSITETESVTLQVNSYVCPVFSIPTNQFPNQKPWNVSVSVTNNGLAGTGQWQGTPPSP